MAWSVHALAAVQAPAEAIKRLKAGEAVELLVEYDTEDVERQAAASRLNSRGVDDDAQLALKADAYRALKARIDADAAHIDRDDLADYSHLPMSFKRFRSSAALDAMLARPEVRAVYPNAQLFAVMAQSLPLIGQPTVTAAGYGGDGATVAVLDTGIDYTGAAFGACTSPGVPAGCRVVVSRKFGIGPTNTNHGTNVAAIVAGVAPAAKIAALNVFSGSSAYVSDIVAAINWAIANRTAYNIVALNMSLGDGVKYTTPCGSGYTFYTAVTNAIDAGITVVAAAGNEAFTDGLASPACTPGAVSVGAVYDANVGGWSWGSGLCTDTTSAADKIACFSNSASFLSLLAPGVFIDAGGFSMGGTSQASPHVAGAVAVLRSAYPAETPAQVVARLSGTGKAIIDPRNGIAKPRLDLLAAARPVNDAFAARLMLAGSGGSASASTVLASRENGEPLHAANPGGHSLWWTLTPSAAGQLSLDTHGSGFDTLLAVYSGSTLATLTPLAANDNDGVLTSAVLLQVAAGVPLAIAVDGASGAAGNALLNWNLNTAARANLSVGVSGPPTVAPGTTASYLLAVSNAGPQAATHVVATLTLPAAANVSTLPPECSLAGSVVACAAGTLGAGSSASFAIELLWAASQTSAALTAGASSDLPDDVLADNGATVMVVVAATADSGDVPTLPEWAALLLAGILFSRARGIGGGRGSAV